MAFWPDPPGVLRWLRPQPAGGRRAWGPSSGNLELRVRQAHRRRARQRSVVRDESPRLGLRVIHVVHGPAEADRLVPELDLDAERPGRITSLHDIDDVVAA